MDINIYHKMRPYHDNEVPSAIDRIIKRKEFYYIASFLYDNFNEKEIFEKFKKVSTVDEFQIAFSHFAVSKIIEKTSDGLTMSGLEKLDNNTPYLFIANHRDIVLDSAFMQKLLVDNNHKTSQITFGSNLMTDEFIVDLGKLNKMFTFFRGGSKIQMYKNALIHSEYIHHVLVNEKESIWIAQRDGRTKDGNDKTQEALIKMLTMVKKESLSTLKELNIVPVTISYEYEPCVIQKINELYLSKNQNYIKSPDEDLNSILSGIKDHKGYIHMNFGTPLNTILNNLENNIGLNKLIDIVIEFIDNDIYYNYALWKNNYIAYDLLMNTEEYSKDKYTSEDKEKFIQYANNKIQNSAGNKNEIYNMFLKLYATPVINKELHKEL